MHITASRRDRRVANPLLGHAPVSRRRFLELLAGAGAGAVVLAAVGPEATGLGRGAGAAVPLPPGYAPTFTDGVACGDPRPDGAIITTRLAPPTGGEPLPVLWEIAEDDTFATIAAGGMVDVGAGDDWSATIPVTGLAADRWYRYRFSVGGTPSPVGRLRTAPGPLASPERLRFAFASCQQRSTTYAALRAVAEEPDLDFFLHLGDYVYVSDGGTISVDDYRSVYHRFKSDPLLQRCHAAVPLVAMWDDGEFYNGVDASGDPSRLANAKKAWFEAMPVIGPAAEPDRAYRRFAWGDLADVFVLDVRAYRDPAIEVFDTRQPGGLDVFDPGRTTLGDAQKQWLKDGLESSSAAWRLLGNPYNMAPWKLEDLDNEWPRSPDQVPNAGVYAPNEAWDDYQAERREILSHLAERGIRDTISVSGHTHIWIASAMAPDVDDPTAPVVAFDFTTGSLTADPDVLADDPVARMPFLMNLARQLLTQNTHMDYLNFASQGYSVVEVTPCATTVEFKAINTYDADALPVTIARFRVHAGADHYEHEALPVPNFLAPDVPGEPPATEDVPLTAPADCRPSTPEPPQPPTEPSSTTSTTTSTTTSGPSAADPVASGPTTAAPAPGSAAGSAPTSPGPGSGVDVAAGTTGAPAPTATPVSARPRLAG